MKVSIYIDADGLEKLAKGDEPYYWDFAIRLADDPVPKDKTLLLDGIEVQLPGRKSATEQALRALEEARQAERASAHAKDREYQVRINNLLSLTYSPAEDSL